MARALNGDRRSLLPLLLLTIVVLIWASNTIISKLVLREMSPALLVLVRFTLATACFHLPVFLIFRRRGPPLRPGELARLGTIGMVGAAGSVLLFTIGIASTPATYAGFILMTGPIWTALLAWLLFREWLGRVRAAGMAIAFLGAVFLATDGRLVAPDPAILTGSAFLLLAQVTWGIYTLLSKPLLARRPPLLILASSHLFALAALWPAAGLLGAWAELPQILGWSTATWLAIGYLAFVNTALSQVLYIYSLRDVSAAQAVSFQYLQPIFTALLAALFLDERPTPLIFACGALILFGLWLVNRPRPGPARSQEPGARSQEPVSSRS
jgi:drug/metabolite transporter (DMT)-like permease